MNVDREREIGYEASQPLLEFLESRRIMNLATMGRTDHIAHLFGSTNRINKLEGP